MAVEAAITQEILTAIHEKLCITNTCDGEIRATERPLGHVKHKIRRSLLTRP